MIDFLFFALGVALLTVTIIMVDQYIRHVRED